MNDFKIAVAGIGYVGLSIATLLSQHSKVVTVIELVLKVNPSATETLEPNTVASVKVPCTLALIFIGLIKNTSKYLAELLS